MDALSRISLSVSLSPYFLALAFPFLVFFLLLLSCTRQTSLIDGTSSWSPPESFHVFWTTLSHLIPARTFVVFSHIQPYQLWAATSFLAYSLLYIVISTFSLLFLF